MTLLDTSAAIDLQYPGGAWYEWAVEAVAGAALVEPVVINHIVLAEIYSSPDPQRAAEWLAEWQFPVEPLDEATAKRAGEARRLHLSRGGPRTGILADFLIGAHAAVRRAPLITRDRQRFASYFPELTIIAPETVA